MGRGFRALLLAIAFPLCAYAAPADDVKALLDQGKAAEAYALGKKYPAQLGNPVFDFYFGVAAVDAGHAGEGVLALERYITNFPENQTARLELARGYFVLGDNLRAREEFDAVQKANPPPAVQANVQRFMDAIRARESAYKTTTGFFAEMGGGYDSNVNGGVGSPNINLPGFGAVTLLTGVKTADSFGYLGVGANVSHPVAPGIALLGSASADAKMNKNDTAFDQGNANLAGGVSFLRDKNLYRLTGSYSELQVQNDWYRKATGIAGEVNHQIDELQMLNGFVQYAKLGYQPPNDVRNAALWAFGGGYRKAFIGSWQPLLTLSATYGQERDIRNRPDLGRKFYGGRAAIAVTPRPKWALSVGATYQEGRYDGPDLLLGQVRKDKYYGVDSALSYALDRAWSVRGEYTYSSNKSNLALYEFERHLVAIKLRYEFK
jgi:hypothetical protein